MDDPDHTPQPPVDPSDDPVGATSPVQPAAPQPDLGPRGIRTRRRVAALGAPARFGRDDVEFSRAIGFFDATYALATTLLVTTLDPGEDGWSSWTALVDSVGQQLIAFVISFIVVAGYWWLNHTFIASLDTISPQIIVGVIAGLAFIVLLPFTTEGMALGGKVPTIVYALNVALVSLSATGLYLLAWRQDLYLIRPDPQVFRLEVWGSMITPAVFLASIPVAALISSDVARWTWILLFPLNRLAARREKRLAACVTATAEGGAIAVAEAETEGQS